MYAGLQLECWNCGSDDHINRDCPHAIAGLECWNCNGNHLERNCPEHQDTRALAAAGLRDAHDEIRRLTDNETITAIIDSCDSLILEFECGNPRNDEPDSDGPPPLVTEDDIHHGSASASSGFANINVGNVLVDTSTGQILSGATRIEASAALEAPVPAPAPASSCGSRPRALTAPHYRNPDGVFVWFDGKGRWRDDSGRYAKAPTNRDRISAADLGSSVGSSKPDLGSSVESGATAGSWVQVPAVEGGVSDGPLPDVR